MSGNSQSQQSAETKITVVIPTYNRAELIHKAVASVLKQSMPSWKILIVDDGSTDHTREVIDEFLRADSRISYYPLARHIGICHVLNEALKLVNSKYLVQLDSDDWLEDTALEKLFSKMESADNNTAVAYGNHYVWKSKKKRLLKRQRSFQMTDKYELICHIQMVYPRFYRTSCLREVGGWDTNDRYKGQYLEDRLILFKLIEQFNFLWVDQPLYNLSRIPTNRLTSDDNRSKFNEVKKDLIIRTLKKWGNEYVPKFSNEGKWLRTELMPNKINTTP